MPSRWSTQPSNVRLMQKVSRPMRQFPGWAGQFRILFRRGRWHHSGVQVMSSTPADLPMEQMVSAIVEGEVAAAATLLRREPRLAQHRVSDDRFFQAGIYHWLYKDDTLLHLAAAGHRTGIVKALIDAGASPDAA